MDQEKQSLMNILESLDLGSSEVYNYIPITIIQFIYN
jgi:hypothetical protein